MARKIATMKKPKASPTSEETEYEAFSPAATGDLTIKEMVQQFVDNPTVKYVASGLATALLTKISTRFVDRYPQITKLAKEAWPNLEEKLAQYQNQSAEGKNLPH